jgi:hypothetical protein
MQSFPGRQHVPYQVAFSAATGLGRERPQILQSALMKFHIHQMADFITLHSVDPGSPTTVPPNLRSQAAATVASGIVALYRSAV